MVPSLRIMRIELIHVIRVNLLGQYLAHSEHSEKVTF